MESSTKILRRMLDERGVEWWDDSSIYGTRRTVWKVGGVVFVAAEVSGRLKVSGYLTPEQAIAATLGAKVTGDTSDGYHTFNELYHHRAVLFSVIVRDHQELAWKSKLHHDGTMYDGMFIVGIETPNGQATYHYDIDPYWDMFDCKELDRAPEWDGHTPSDAIERISTLGRGTCHAIVSDNLTESEGTGDAWADCSECGQLLFVLTDPSSKPPNYCPNCGAKVVSE